MSKKGTPTRYPGVTRLSDHTYRLRGRVRDPKTGEPVDLDRIVEASNTHEASRLRAELIAELDRPRVQSQGRVRLQDFANCWYDSKLPKLKPATAAHYVDVMDNHIRPTLGGYFVDAITVADLIKWRDDQAARLVHGRKRTSPATVNSRLRVLKSIMRAAVEDLGLDRDPTRRLSALRERRHDADRNCLTADELRRFLDKALELAPKWHPFFYLLAFSGMRFGELTALRWNDIDEAAGKIRIVRAQWKGHEDTTKTDEIRSVPLFPELLEVLAAHRERVLAAQIKRARRTQVADIDAATIATDALVFASRIHGRHMHNTAPRKALLKCLAAAGITHRVTVHGSRRTFNNLLRQNTSAQVVRSMTGHATEEMTEHYSHVDLDEKRRAVAGLVLVVGGAGKGKP